MRREPIGGRSVRTPASEGRAHGSAERTAGYDFGHVGRSPVSLEDLRKLEAAASFTEEDRRALRRAGEIFAPQAEAMVDAWRTKIGEQPHLAKWFFGPDGEADEDYKASVKPRFVRWVVDLCTRPFDQDWLDYQHEIAIRHTPEKKNATDHARTPALVPLRYVLSFSAEIVVSARERLRAGKLTEDEIDRLHGAWTKAVILSVALWSEAYAKDGLW